VAELSSDPKVVNAAISAALVEEPVVVETAAPSSTEVSLPGGFVSKEGILAKYAEVRELNGADEEAIAKAGFLGKALQTILQKGLVSIGGESVDKDGLDELLASDRDAILLGIRKVTFGNSVEYRAVCQDCGTDQIVDIDLDADIPIKELEDPLKDRRWTVKVKSGEVILTLPDGEVQRRLMENSDKTNAELNTILLSGCVLAIDGKTSSGAQSVLKLGMAERERLVEEIIIRNPGPRLGEVTKNCEACGNPMDTPLSLTALFRL